MPTSVQEKRQPFSKGVIRFFGILLLPRHPRFRLLFARGLRIPPDLRCCAYAWPCAMRRVPGRLRTCAERRLGACLCRLGYGNLADYSSPRSTFVADINLSFPKEREGNGMPVMGKNVGGWFRSNIRREWKILQNDDRNRVGRYHSA